MLVLAGNERGFLKLWASTDLTRKIAA